jgi:hypothetical protein
MIPTQIGDWYGMVSHKDQYLDLCFFFNYIINDLPKSIKNNAEVVLFADDTSIIVNSPNPIFKSTVNKVFHDINRWFTSKLLSLNVDKTQFMQFETKTSSLIDLNIFHGKK